MIQRALWLPAFALLLCAGCADSDTPADTSEKAASTSTETTEKAATEAATALAELPTDLPAEEQRATLGGRWFLMVSVGDGETYVALLEIDQGAESEESQGDGKSTVSILETAPAFARWKLAEHETTGEDIRLVFDVEGTEAPQEESDSESEGEAPAGINIRFNGKLHEGIVYGNLQSGARSTEPARLFPTEDASIAGHDKPIPAPGRSAWQSAVNNADQFAAMRKFLSEHPKSPLALQMYDRLFGNAFGQINEKLDKAEVEQLAADYMQCVSLWGSRMRDMALYNLGVRLSLGMSFPEIGLKYIDQAAQETAPDIQERYTRMVEYARTRADLAIARNRIKEAREQFSQGEEEAATTVINEISDKYPFDPIVTFTAAKHALNENHVNDALDLFGRLAAVPLMENQLTADPSWQGDSESPPSETVELLWKAKHSRTDGLKDFLASIYQQSVDEIIQNSQQEAPEKEGSRTLLCELFTGAQCPPCIAADLASAALEQTYASHNVIVLRHHQHIPGPDPLTNEDSESRFRYYIPNDRRRATPTMIVNGNLPLVGFGGAFDDTPRIYRSFREQTDPLVEKDSEIEIKLVAEMNDGNLNINAEANGLEEVGDELRLVLFLVEEEVEFVAANGIRHHEMLVRSLLSAPEGVPPSEGRLTYTDSIEFEGFKQTLQDYLTAFEARTPGVDFKSKPLELESLYLAGCVQNHETKEILQAAIVPVRTAGEAEAVSSIDATSSTRAPVSAVRPQ